MTTVYFIRHAEPNYNNHNDFSRELSGKGLEDRKLVSKFLSDKMVDVIFSSPYKRAVETVLPFTEINGLEIKPDNRFRERKVGDSWIDNFNEFSKRQWEDFSYKLENGECLREVQQRNIEALEEILDKFQNKTIAVGSHGTALSTIINYYDKSFGYSDFENIKDLMPWVVRFIFEEKKCISIEKYNLFE